MNILKDLRKFIKDVEHLAKYHENEFESFTQGFGKFMLFMEQVKGEQIAHIMMAMNDDDEDKPEVIRDQGAEA